MAGCSFVFGPAPPEFFAEPKAPGPAQESEAEQLRMQRSDLDPSTLKVSVGGLAGTGWTLSFCATIGSKRQSANMLNPPSKQSLDRPRLERTLAIAGSA